MTQSDDPLGRAASAIADLNSPFYAEERQRDVWNEASAVGFQAMLWCMLGLVCAMVWIGGQALFGWALTLLLLTGLSSWLAVLHANRLGVTGWEGARLRRPRMLVVTALIVATGVGVVVRSDAALSPSGIAGGVVGFAVAMAGAGAAAWWTRRQTGSDDSLDSEEGFTHD